jgi:hypothetical protein
VRDHQHWHVEAPNCPAAQEDQHGRRGSSRGDAGCSYKIECNDESPKHRTYPYREKGQHGQDPGCKVAVGGEAGGQVGADDAWKDKDESEEAEAVQSSDHALRFKPAHLSEPGQNIHVEAKQARDITQNEMDQENDLLWHLAPCTHRIMSIIRWIQNFF